MHVAAIINPVSGAGLDPHAAERRVALVRDVLESAPNAALSWIAVSERAGHARELAAKAAEDGVDLVLVWGGDGTVNEAGSALVNTRTALGLVPAGSGNGLAASLRVPRDPTLALARALAAPVRAIDVGLLAERPFFNVAGIGFDARIATLFNRRGRGSRGRWPYVAIGVREGCRYCAQDYELELDGDRQHLRALIIAFANGREYGMGACIAPAAQLDDGLLDATVVEDRGLVARFWDTRHLAFGSVDRAPRVAMRQLKRATITAPGPLEFHVDGEPGVAHDRIDVRVLPRALLVSASV